MLSCMKQSGYDDRPTLGNVVVFPCPLPGEIFQSPRSKTGHILNKGSNKEAIRDGGTLRAAVYSC